MLRNSARRWLAGLGVAGAFVAASATPAFAADPTPSIADVKGAQGFSLYANPVIVAPGGPEKWISLYSLVNEPFTDYTVKVDRSDVDGFAEVRMPVGQGSCSEEGAVLTCVKKVDPKPSLSLLTLPVLPRETAKAGQEGTLKYTVTTQNAGTASYESTITVGEGVDLTAEPLLHLNGSPGSTVRAALEVGNQGQTHVHGAVLFFYGSYELAPSRRYQNCEYFANSFATNVYACKLDGTVTAGGSAKLDDSFAFAIPGDAWAPNKVNGSAIWMTPADWDAFRAQMPGLGESTRGDDGVLTLTSSAPSRTMSRLLKEQTDVDPTNNETWIQLTVQGDQQADVAADGATVRGEVGESIPVTVGFTNNGPAAINAGGEQGRYTVVLVTLPEGTTATKAPEQCTAGKADAAVYACYLPEVVGRGKKAEFPFTLRIDKAGTLTGEVQLLHNDAHDDGLQDLNPANDLAKIVVTAAGGQGDAGGGGGGDGHGGDGGTLPITGSSTGLIAGVGALLLTAGVGGYVVARRRKTRFVA
ncbi:LPXTG cell wall anchor domain-containing protein [Micromonospora narathiwatensis]|uniref:LPXTG-motif cell wall anchor domain-containing protein n=1 Tax=Micromonospora narathiwatensis TaxID=299146 RepID=A0A1A9AB14_9ACTN|nr:LPXTG cell wall anchor domain-containing protein [Micromonospora narathiwatensis]SBT53679.1 LPXTG-motif cell wall anchor domain-containing protein [Micromonospora narathiwatensis]